MIATAKERKLERTVTVRISRELSIAIWEKMRKERKDPAEFFGPLLEPWVKKALAAATAALNRGKFTDAEKRDGKPQEKTVRIWRSQVRRLLIVAAITGRPVSDMIEERLWELLTIG